MPCQFGCHVIHERAVHWRTRPVGQNNCLLGTFIAIKLKIDWIGAHKRVPFTTKCLQPSYKTLRCSPSTVCQLSCGRTQILASFLFSVYNWRPHLGAFPRSARPASYRATRDQLPAIRDKGPYRVIRTNPIHHTPTQRTHWPTFQTGSVAIADIGFVGVFRSVA